jgi:hypothetical protein
MLKAFGVFCVMGGVYYLLQDSQGFDNLMHGKSPKKDLKQRSLEDFGKHPHVPHLSNQINTDLPRSRLIAACFHSTRKECLNHRYPWSAMGRRRTKKTTNNFLNLQTKGGSESGGGVLVLLIST